MAAIIAGMLLPIHPPGPTRGRVLISALIALAAAVAMAVQVCRGQLRHRILAGFLLLFAGAMVIGMAQQWMILSR